LHPVGGTLAKQMSDEGTTARSTAPPQRYKWPWFVLAAFILAIILAVVWMRAEIERTRRIRDANAPAPATGSNQTQP
jgi:hypothetical protein